MKVSEWLQGEEAKMQERTIKAIANRRRVGILKYLKKEKQATVQEIARAIKLSMKATSRHLIILSGADIVEREQRSIHVYYWIKKEQNMIVKHLILTL